MAPRWGVDVRCPYEQRTARRFENAPQRLEGLTASEGHTTTLLQNGPVLVTAGSKGPVLATAEVYAWCRTPVIPSSHPRVQRMLR
jgi:hypothetical protein